jgi:hypothetical protein
MRSYGLMLRTLFVFLAGVCLAARAEAGADLSKLDLSGEWYVLIHYKDSRSEDKSMVQFKDLGWSIQQTPQKLSVEEFPYVIFDAGSEEVRRTAMRGHKPWAPEGLVLDELRSHLDVSSRAARKTELTGDLASGMKSAAAKTSGRGTMDFTRNWDVTWAPAKVRIKIVDSLSTGNAAFGEMEEATVFEITDQPSPTELVGTWSEGEKSGKLRLIRAKERRVLK